MVSKGLHQKKEINAALQALDPEQFDVVPDKNGHRWGWVVCLTCGNRRSINSTPRNPHDEAERIGRFAALHRHTEEKL